MLGHKGHQGSSNDALTIRIPHPRVVAAVEAIHNLLFPRARALMGLSEESLQHPKQLHSERYLTELVVIGKKNTSELVTQEISKEEPMNDNDTRQNDGHCSMFCSERYSYYE